jgi:hypothetical protein
LLYNAEKGDTMKESKYRGIKIKLCTSNFFSREVTINPSQLTKFVSEIKSAKKNPAIIVENLLEDLSKDLY